MSPRRSAAQRNKRAKAERWSASPMDDRDRPFDDVELERWWQETGYDELRELLLWRWDPLGMADEFPDAANEYHDYGRPMVALLDGGANAGELAWHLHEITRSWIGLGDGVVPSPETVRAAEEVAAWFERSLRRWRAFGAPFRPD